MRWWTERAEPKGWRCMTCHPPLHLAPEAIRREGQGGLLTLPPPEPPDDPPPLLRVRPDWREV